MAIKSLLGDLDMRDSARPPSRGKQASEQDGGSLSGQSAADEFSGLRVPDSWPDEKEKTVLGPYNYVASMPGKEFRTLLLKAFNTWLDVPPASLEVITGVVRMLHTASLLIDDIQDNSPLRRGRPAAHSIFGVAQTINSANYAYFLALAELRKLRNPDAAVEVYTSEMMHLHRGQGMDLFWRDTLTCPTEAEYLQMASDKTGGLFRLAVRLMQAESERSYDCVPLAGLLGPIFQMADDYKNLVSADYAHMKGTCEDLSEGKFSFPVVHSVRADLTDRRLLNILARRPTDDETKKYAVEYIESTGSLSYTKRAVARLMEEAKRVADEIDGASGKSQVFHALLDKLSL